MKFTPKENKRTYFMKEFEKSLRLAILMAVSRAREDGIDSMSLDNLIQVTVSPRAAEGAPVGANAGYNYRQMFTRIALEVAPKFIIKES